MGWGRREVRSGRRIVCGGVGGGGGGGDGAGAGDGGGDGALLCVRGLI